MKINIGYTLLKKKLSNKKIYTVLLSSFVILELLTFLCIKNQSTEIKNVFNSEKRELRLKDAIEDLKGKEITFLSATKENETYLLKVRIKGTKEVFMETIDDLKNFTIKDFTIDFNKNIIEGKVTLKYSPKGEF